MPDKKKRWPQFCPDCKGDHNNPQFIFSGDDNGCGSIGGHICNSEFHKPRTSASMGLSSENVVDTK